MPATTKAIRLQVGKRVQELRQLRGLSQERLAERVGNSQKHISLVERGEVNVGIDILSQIATELSVDITDLFLAPSARSATTYAIGGRELDALERALKTVLRVAQGSSRRTKPDTD